MSEWKRLRLHEIADRVAVKNSAGHDRVMTVSAEHGLVDQERFFSKRVASTDLSGYWVIEPGDFVYNKSTSKDAPWGVVAQYRGECPGVVTPLYFAFRARNQVADPRFLLLACNSADFFESLRGMLREGARSHGLLNVRLKEFYSATVALPPLAEQRRIVDVMAAVDAKVAALDVEVRAARGLLTARRAELIVNASPVIPVRDAFSVLMGRQRAPQHATGPYMTNYLRSANVGDGALDLADIKQMNFTPHERKKFSLQVGDVLVSEGSASAVAVGQAGVWQGEIEGPVCFQKTLLRFRGVKGLSLPSFTNHWCQWAYESGTFLRISSGTNIKHITAVRVLELPVSLPTLDEQISIVRELDGLATHHSSIIDELANLRHFRSALLIALLNQEVEIPESYDRMLETVS